MRIDALILVALVASPLLGQCGLNRNKHFYFASLLLPISENEHSKFGHDKKKEKFPYVLLLARFVKKGVGSDRSSKGAWTLKNRTRNLRKCNQ